MSTKEKKVLDVYFQITPAYTVRQETYQEKEYLVVPVTMMTEGVRSGSHGPVLHLAEELGKIPASWDGIPVTIGHPYVDGQYVSANSPEVLEDWAVGQIFNTEMAGTALKAEAWLEKERLLSISPEVHQSIIDNKIMEVSIGVFSEEEETEGTFDGINYHAIARNHRPNHLALLPDEVGACSIVDGCGIRVNKEGGVKMFVINKENEQEVLKALAKTELLNNETGFRELREKTQTTLDNKDGNGFSYYLEELYGDYLVYRESKWTDGDRSTKLYKQGYQENAAGDVELTGEAVHVKKVVEYEDVPQVNTGRRRTKEVKTNEEGQEMKDCKVCKERATALINNKLTKYTEKDREFLEGLDVEQLDLMDPVVVEAEKPAVVTNAQIMSAFKESVKTPEEFLEFIPEEMRDQFKSGLEMQTNAKAKMITVIMDNTEDVWTKEELEAMPTGNVTKVYKSVKPEAVEGEEEGIFINPTPQVNKETEGEVMAPFGVTFKTKED